MEYAIIIILLLYGIVKYDFKGRTDKNGIYYKLVYILMVLMSGLAYRVGADLVSYESSYYLGFKGELNYEIGDLLTHFSRAQPGWVIFSTLMFKLGASFTVFKLIQAAFSQFAVFYIIRKYTSYKYTALLLFFVFLFPHVNFNVLRESFAISFFLLSIPHLINRNWIKYSMYIFGAFMFHAGAIILFLCPFIFYLDFNSRNKVLITAAIFFILSLVAASSNLTNAYMNFVYSTNSVGLIEQSEYYLLRDRYVLTGIENIGKSLFFFIINMIPLYYISKKCDMEQKKVIPLAFLYILVFLVNDFVPIAYRYKDYTRVLYYIALSIFLVEISKKYLIKQNILLVLLLFGLYIYPIRSYFAVNEYYGEPAWTQYYPYHSVIDKGTSPIRESIFYYKR